jgi:hypothetical protein
MAVRRDASATLAGMRRTARLATGGRRFTIASARVESRVEEFWMTTSRRDPILLRVVSYALALGAVVSGASGEIWLAAFLGVVAFTCLALRLTLAFQRGRARRAA